MHCFSFIYLFILNGPVQGLGRADMCASGWAPITPAGKRWGSLQGVLPRPPSACGGGLLQPAHTPPSQRSRLHSINCLQTLAPRYFILLSSSSGIYVNNPWCVPPPDSSKPLTPSHVHQQRYVLNDKSKTISNWMFSQVDLSKMNSRPT